MFCVRTVMDWWTRARTQAPSRVTVGLSLGLVLALAAYVALSLFTRR